MVWHSAKCSKPLLKLWSAHHSQARCKGRTYPPASAEEESKTEHPIIIITYMAYLIHQMLFM